MSEYQFQVLFRAAIARQHWLDHLDNERLAEIRTSVDFSGLTVAIVVGGFLSVGFALLQIGGLL